MRDIVRGVNPQDYDIATSAAPEQVQSLFPHTAPVGASFGVILVIEDGRSFEIATYRTENDYQDGRRPGIIRFSNVRADVLRRDFTVNGLIMDPFDGRVIDYVEGQTDIARKIIRTIGDADQRFGEDHLRILRAVRFAANLNFAIDGETFAAIKKNAKLICRISAERIREELMSLLVHGGARRGLEMLAETGLLELILPEVHALIGVDQPPRFHPEGDVWEHTMRMMAILSDNKEDAANPCMAWAALLHDIGKPPTRSEDALGVHFYGHVQKGEEIASAVLQRLRFSNKELETILALIHYHMHFMNVKEMRLNRLKRFLRMPHFELHLELHRLDCLASHRMLDNYYFCKDKLKELDVDELDPPRLINGHDLKAMGFEPGPLFKEILTSVEDAQLEGGIRTPEEAKDYVLTQWGESRGKKESQGSS